MQKVISGKALAEKYEKMTIEQKMAVTNYVENLAIKDISKTSENNQHTYRKAGRLKGGIKYMAPDFDEPLSDFKEYM